MRRRRASLRPARLAADLRNGIPRQTPKEEVVVTKRDGESVIELVVPADEEYVGMVRAVVGRAASLAGFSFDGTDHLCLAASEAANLLIGADPDALKVRLEVNSDSIDGELAVTAPTNTWPTPSLETDLRWQILDAVCDDVWTLSDGRSGIGWHQPAQ